MVVTIVVVAAIALYAAFVVRHLLKKRSEAKKSGGSCGCGGCASGGCPHCSK